MPGPLRVRASAGKEKGMSERKGLHPLAWVGIGCGVIILIALLGFGACTILVAKTASDIAEEMENNPEITAARAFVFANPELEMVSVDEEAKTVTIRNTTTGEEMTVDASKLADGEISFQGEGGESLTFGQGGMTAKTDEGEFKIGGGGEAEVPEWAPVPDGAKDLMQMMSSVQNGEKSTMITFTVATELEALADAMEAKVKETGLTTHRSVSNFGGMGQASVVGEGDGKVYKLSCMKESAEGPAQCTLTLSEKVQ